MASKWLVDVWQITLSDKLSSSLYPIHHQPKALESYVAPPLTDEEKRHIEAEQQRLDAIMRIKASRRKNRRQKVVIRQLSFNFAV